MEFGDGRLRAVKGWLNMVGEIAMIEMAGAGVLLVNSGILRKSYSGLRIFFVICGSRASVSVRWSRH